MTRGKRCSFQESPSAPKSPRLRQDAKIDSAAAATGGPKRSCAGSTQVRHPPQLASIPTTRTPQRQVRGPAAAHRRTAPAATPPPPSSALAPSTSTVVDPRPPPPPSSALTAARGPLDLPPPPSSSALSNVRAPQDTAAAETLSSSAALTPSLQDACCSPSTPPPPPARAPIPSPSSPHMWNSIGGTSGMPYSFADAVTRGANRSLADKPPGNQSPDDNLVQRLCDYLKNIPRNTANNSNKGQIITVMQTEILILEIVEQHLDEHDSELAYAVFHSEDSFKKLVYPAVSQFLISIGIVNNTVGGMNASFYTMPPSTKTLEGFIREQGSLVSIKSIFDGNVELCVASNIGMMLVHGFLVYILNIHKQGRTWNGEFSTGDMVVGDCLRCWITNKISVEGNSDGRAKDLCQIADIFKPMFTINEEMALYFDVLDEDLRKADIEAKWYREYLVSHPALKSSTARYYLECGLHHAAASFRSKVGLVQSILQKYNRWKDRIPHEATEGTPDTVLFEVFYHKHDIAKGLDPYACTVGGLLSYKRNLLQHGHEYIKVQDHTEVEQFAAKTFSQALPNIVWELLRHHKMNGPFKDHWEAYCNSRVDNAGNTEGRTGIRIHFAKMSVAVDRSEDLFVWKG